MNKRSFWLGIGVAAPVIIVSGFMLACAGAPAQEHVFARGPSPSLRTVEFGMLQTEGTVIAADDGSFVFRPGEQFQTPFSSPGCPDNPTPNSFQSAVAAGGRSVWVAVPQVERPLYGLLLFCDVPTSASGPAARSHLVRIPSQYIDATEGGRLSVVYEPLTAEVQDTSGQSCTNTCSYAHDGECDDGGPNSLYSVCTLGTDCGDCGPRGASTTTARVPAWMLFLSRVPMPGVTHQSSPPSAVASASGTASTSIPQSGGEVADVSEGAGIGAQIRLQGQDAVIVRVLPNGAAAASGLTQGDAIVAIDGETVASLGDLESVTAKLRGQPNTTVTVRVRRLVSGEEEDLTLTRQPL